MMLLNAYTIFDHKALQYYPPFFAATDAAAARSFGDLVNDPNTNVGRHPSDYVLYCCGTFLDSKGQLEPISPLRHIADAVAFVPIRPAPLFEDGNAPLRQGVLNGFPQNKGNGQ